MAKILPKSVPMGGLPQSVVIFGVLIFLFVVYITTKGQLSKYLNVLGLGGAASTASSAVTAASTAATNTTKALTGYLNTGSLGSVTSGITSGLSGITSQASSALSTLNVQPLSVSSLTTGLGAVDALNLFAA